jgi:hypothetical protein
MPKAFVDMPDRRRLTGAALLAALLGVLALPIHAAVAATPSSHGYWWRLQTGTGPRLPAPPFVPEGGLWVANDSSGQQAISALRYRAPSGVEIRRLDLKVAQNSGQGALMLACSAREAWTAVQAGEWDTRPATRCDVAFVRGVLNGDIWSFDVRGLGRSGTLDVVILPPPGLQATFSVAFERPDASTVVTQTLPGSPSPSEDGTPTQRGPRSSPSVLGTKTTAPGSPPASQPQPQPSPGSPSSSANGSRPPLASGPTGDSGSPGRPLLLAVATVLAIGALTARVLLPHRARL